ncbi:hypothetical protein ACEN8K_33940, partial [Variovorax sp. CT11-76]
RAPPPPAPPAAPPARPPTPPPARDDGLQDYLGVQMAQITDCALTRGWEPVGFVQDEGFRVYRYERVRGRRRLG